MLIAQSVRRVASPFAWAVKYRQPFSLMVVLVCLSLLLCMPATWSPTNLPGRVLDAAGFFLVVVAALGRVWCGLYISGYKEDRIVDVGPYALIRNPLYMFSFLGAIGLGLATGRLLIVILLAVAFLGYYPLVVLAEEDNLREKFGPIYSDYARRTPRFFPRRLQLVEPDRYPTRPRHLRRALVEVSWFFWAYLLMQWVLATGVPQQFVAMLNAR